MNSIKLANALSAIGTCLLLTSIGCGDGRDGPADGGSSLGETAADTNDDEGEHGNSTGSEGNTEANDDANDDTPETETTEDPTDDPTDDPTAPTDDDGAEGAKFDLGIIPDAAFNCGDGNGGDPEFSFLWAANSDQGTISKIDTNTVTEVGRFMTRPDLGGSPSRTSVSLSGDVAVANRNGGVTKIYANPENCEESNGVPGIQTSANNQYLPWDQEECRAWHTPMNYPSQRPVAWAPGTFNAGTCKWDDEELWTSGNSQGATIDILLLDGEDGSIKETIQIPANGGANGLDQDGFGIYGGASDGEGNFWGSQLGSGKLLRVNREDLTYDIFNAGPFGGWYGMTVDSDGMVWLCSNEAGRFDPETETWQQAQVGGYAGCMADATDNGLLWMSSPNGGVVGVDRDTLQVSKTCPGPGAYGISIDFQGYVWAVAYGTTVTKFDPDTCQTWSYNGLVGAYTYSDMTGYALSNAGSPSG